jgi:hypothetical protein
MSLHPNRAASRQAEPSRLTGRRIRLRAAAKRVSLVAEALLVVGGAIEFWRASAAGQPVSRPGQIAFWAGLVGLLVNLLAPAVRARIEWARAGRT